MRLQRPSAGLIRVLKVLDLYDLFLTQPETPVPIGSGVSRISDDLKDQQFSIDFHPTVDQINSAQSRFEEFLKTLMVEDLLVFELTTVFYEVGTNIRIHGQLNSRDVVKFTASYIDGNVVLEFTDPGQPYILPEIPPDFDPQEIMAKKRTHGFGLILIDRLTDGITYERIQDKFNVLRLRKQWR
jgi:anti-sigma regulatory factor (Ser/Thr protein kinase)